MIRGSIDSCKRVQTLSSKIIISIAIIVYIVIIVFVVRVVAIESHKDQKPHLPSCIPTLILQSSLYN